MSWIELLKVIFLGIVEGITEWLPVSSTGHMILVDEFIHLNVSDEFLQMFLVVIQLGAILAVVLVFWQKLWPFHRKREDQESFWEKKSDHKMIAGLQDFDLEEINMSWITWEKAVCAPGALTCTVHDTRSPNLPLTIIQVIISRESVSRLTKRLSSM